MGKFVEKIYQVFDFYVKFLHEMLLQSLQIQNNKYIQQKVNCFHFFKVLIYISCYLSQFLQQREKRKRKGRLCQDIVQFINVSV